MERVAVTCRLEPDDVVFLDKLAELMERDRSFLIKMAVSDFIVTQRWQIEEVEQARDEARSGKILSEDELDADVRTW